MQVLSVVLKLPFVWPVAHTLCFASYKVCFADYGKTLEQELFKLRNLWEVLQPSFCGFDSSFQRVMSILHACPTSEHFAALQSGHLCAQS